MVATYLPSFNSQPHLIGAVSLGLNFLQTFTGWYIREPWKYAALGDSGSDDGSNVDMSIGIIVRYSILRKLANDEVMLSEEPYNNWLMRTVAMPIESGEVVSS